MEKRRGHVPLALVLISEVKVSGLPLRPTVTRILGVAQGRP